MVAFFQVEEAQKEVGKIIPPVTLSVSSDAVLKEKGYKVGKLNSCIQKAASDRPAAPDRHGGAE